jgi:transcriptional regulator
MAAELRPIKPDKVKVRSDQKLQEVGPISDGPTTKEKKPRKPNRISPVPKTRPVNIYRADKQIEAVNYRKQGKSYRAIAALMQEDVANVFRMVQQALRETREKCNEEAADLRQQELERLDAIYEAMFKEAEAGNERAAAVCVQINKRRCAMLGLDAPQKIEAQFVKGYSVPDCSPDAFPDPPKPEDG